MTVAEPITEERLARCVAVAAYIVARYGSYYAPLFERLERELIEMRVRQDPVERARRYLQAMSLPADGRALTFLPAA